jgi:hypothetical protein
MTNIHPTFQLLWMNSFSWISIFSNITIFCDMCPQEAAWWESWQNLEIVPVYQTQLQWCLDMMLILGDSFNTHVICKTDIYLIFNPLYCMYIHPAIKIH